MPDACTRRLDEWDLAAASKEREMAATTPKKKVLTPLPRRWFQGSPKAFQKRSNKVDSKPAFVPDTGFSRDARGSLEIFGASASQRFFGSPAWHDAMETAENLVCPHGVSEEDHEEGRSSVWMTKSPLSKVPENCEVLGTSSPVSIVLDYGVSDQGSEEQESEPSPSRIRRFVPLTPHRDGADVVYEAPVDIEEQWKAMLEGNMGRRARVEENFGFGVEEEVEEHWQGVLDGGVEDAGPEQEDYDTMGRRSVGAWSAYSDEVRSERALQWGYDVPLRISMDAASTASWRTSTVSSGSRSSAGSNSSQVIPRLVKDVRDAITSFNLAFVVCDASGPIPSYDVLYASGGFFRMTGYEADEVIGRNCRFLHGPETSRKEVARIRRALRAGEAYSGKILNYKKDGTKFWNVLSISPIRDNDGKLIKYIGMQAEASDKKSRRSRRGGEKAPVPEVITAITPEQHSRPEPPIPVKGSRIISSSAVLPDLALPPLKESEDALPKTSYRYSLSRTLSTESAADWQALATLRAELRKSAKSLAIPESPEVELKTPSTPRSSRLALLLRKLNKKISDRLKGPEVEYVDCEALEKPKEMTPDASFDGRGIYRRWSMDYRRVTPSINFSQLDVPERGPRLSMSHCGDPALTLEGRNQFVIIH